MKKVKIQLVNIVNGELFEEFLMDEKLWRVWKKAKGKKSWNTFIAEKIKNYKIGKNL
jgi:hypothetical protein